MQCKKIVYTDSEKGDLAITGKILEEDEYFIKLQSRNGLVYRLGKKSIVLIKDYPGGEK